MSKVALHRDVGRMTVSTAVLSTLSAISCTSNGGPSYDAIRADVDRAGLHELRAVEEDDHALEGVALDRATYVRAVLRRNPSIDEARFAWRAAVARVRSSGAFDDPTVTLEIAPLSVASSSAPLGYSAGISQRLPWPGKLAFEEAVANAEALTAKSDFEETRRELALTAALLYDEYFVAVRSIEINAQHVTLMHELKAAALAQLETGRASAQDPLQAEAELTHMEHDVVILASRRDVTVAQMDELLHRNPELPLPPPTTDLVLPNAPDIAGSKGLADEAVTNSPEINAARLRTRAEQARADRARRESYPDLTVSTSYNSMWDTPEHRWMVGLGFNLPIQLSRRAGRVEEAEAARAMYESKVASLIDRARTEVVVALNRVDEAHHVLRLFEERLLPVARDQVDAARDSFIASRNDFVAVISAEKNQRSTELDYQMARATFDQRCAELDRALGRIPGLSGQRGAQ